MHLLLCLFLFLFHNNHLIFLYTPVFFTETSPFPERLILWRRCAATHASLAHRLCELWFIGMLVCVAT